MRIAGTWVGMVCAAQMLAVGAGAASCSAVKEHVAGPAETALLAAEYEKAAGLYRDALTAAPGDVEARAGLVRVLLREQKVADAGAAVADGLAKTPGSAVLLTARAEVELREGEPWVAAQTASDAFKADACLPRLHLVVAELSGLNSRYKTQRQEIELAHRLDPWDADIRGEWIGTLPLRQRVEEMRKYLAGPTGDDAEDRKDEEKQLEEMTKSLTEPHPPCRLVSTATETEIPFLRLMYDATEMSAFGLDVKLNDHRASLEIDTGAGGILVSRSVAQHAGLKPFSETEVGGIGDEGAGKGYLAYADSIKIGNLEFQNCMVEVMGGKNPLDIDGLIGMDVFSKFLVTLDYPGRKLALSALPARPGEAVAAPTLGAHEEDEEEDTKAVSSGPFDRYVSPEMKDYTAVYRRGHMLMLPVGLNQGKARLFIVDTGAWATSISPEAAREVTKVHGDGIEHIRGLSGTVKKSYTADEVTLTFAKTSQKIRGVPAFDTSNISRNLGLEISGFVGASTLELLTVHIDYRDGLVRFDYDPKNLRTLHYNLNDDSMK